MSENYSDEVLNEKYRLDMNDGIKAERDFFSITEDDLRNKFHVLPTDSLEEAKKKIMSVISTDKFLYDYFKKDPLYWELKLFEPGFYTSPAKLERVLTKDELLEKNYTEEQINKMRLPAKESEIIQTVQKKFTIKFVKKDLSNVVADPVFLERFEKEFKELLNRDNAFLQILKNKFLAVNKPKFLRKRRDPDKLLLIPDVELHLGKLGSRFDSTDSYDYKKALYRYLKIIQEAEKVQDRYNASVICMTIGNDFFNTDTEQNTTTAGTEQHNDTRFEQMISNGIAAHLLAINKMKTKCDKLIIKYNPGNHDFLIDYMLYMALFHVYRNDPKVEIIDEIKQSRWNSSLFWKGNLMVFAHGKTPEGRGLKDTDLGLVPFKFFPEEAKNATSITVHAGHLHNASSRRLENGVYVYRNGSPCGDGAWDSGNLYASDKSHQVYVYEANNGVLSTVNIKLNKQNLEKGIKMPPITDDTKYTETIESSLNNCMEDIMFNEAKELYRKNERDIAKINKDFKEKLDQIEALFNNNQISETQRDNLLNIIGYNNEIAPYLELRYSLNEKLQQKSRKLVLR